MITSYRHQSPSWLTSIMIETRGYMNVRIPLFFQNCRVLFLNDYGGLYGLWDCFIHISYTIIPLLWKHTGFIRGFISTASPEVISHEPVLASSTVSDNKIICFTIHLKSSKQKLASPVNHWLAQSAPGRLSKVSCRHQIYWALYPTVGVSDKWRNPFIQMRSSMDHLDGLDSAWSIQLKECSWFHRSVSNFYIYICWWMHSSLFAGTNTPTIWTEAQRQEVCRISAWYKVPSARLRCVISWNAETVGSSPTLNLTFEYVMDSEWPRLRSINAYRMSTHEYWTALHFCKLQSFWLGLSSY